MRAASWPLEGVHAGDGVFGYDASAWEDLRSIAYRRRAAAVTSIASLGLGMTLLALGVGAGAFAVGFGVLLAGRLDRRLLLLLAILLMPGLTAFNGLELARVAGGILDVRLVLTGVLAGAVWFWILVDRPVPSVYARIFGLYVLAAVLLAPLNDVSPVRALPVLGRDALYLGAFVGAQAWLGSVRGTHAVLIAATVGVAVPALAGVVQWAAGGGLVAAGAWRLTGSYGTSPVGMALAMQLAVICLAGAALSEGVAKRLRWIAGLVALALMAVLLAQTSSRLPFATTVAAVLVLEVVRRRWVGVVVVGVLSAALLATSSGLAERVGSTFEPAATPAVLATPPVPSPPPAAPSQVVEDAGDIDVGGGAASLRYRLFLWRTMVDEWRGSPLLGRGTGSFATLLEQRIATPRVAPHNDYLYALVEGGIVLLLLYVALQLAVLVGLLRAVASGREVRIAMIAACVFVATNIANSINNAVFYADLQVIVWTLVGSALVAARTGSRDPARGQRAGEARSTLRG